MIADHRLTGSVVERCDAVLRHYTDVDVIRRSLVILADAMHWADATGMNFTATPLTPGTASS